ncbi:MAG: DEAD/DEAH box helicase [Parachlamydiaceae bacterium]|nr:DEAD/DEAH box helicase [Parachlamydiaceae bacterium]
MTKQPTFESFGLDEKIMQALQEAGFITPSPIQLDVIPLILNGKDLIGQAQTGTGKTLAFGLPALNMVAQNPGSQFLVLTPTRELAKQVSDEIFRFGKHLDIRTSIICGGKSSKVQIDSIKRGVQVVVATPGRLLDLLQSNLLPNFQPSIVILDEADEMLDMGFLDDIKQIFRFLPKERQTLMFSATMPGPIQQLAKEILNHPLFVSVTPKETTNQDIEQFYYMVREEERDHAIARLIDGENPLKAVIFCRTKKDVDRLTHVLSLAGHQVRGLHGDMEQNQREEVIRNFRSHIRILVATDVAARGLNVSEISHVFNYHLPFDPASYVHRIGRTGRAGNKGIACTLVTTREWRDFQRYEKILSTRIERGEIPTLQEVKEVKHRQLARTILEQSLHENAENVLNLMKDVDLKTVTTKVLSYLLAQQIVAGPEEIGLGAFQQKDDFRKRNESRPREKRYGSRESSSRSNDSRSSRPRSQEKPKEQRFNSPKFSSKSNQSSGPRFSKKSA